MLGRGAAGTGLEQAAAVHQRHDGEHLGAGAELHDREQVGQVVAQHVAGHRDGVLALADALQRDLHRFYRRQDADVQTAGVVILEVGLDLLDQLGIVGAVGVEPEDRRCAAFAGSADGQLDPVLDRCVLGLAHAPDVAGFDVMAEQRLAVFVDDDDGAVCRDLERLVVGTVLFGLLCHQADVGDATHGGRVEGAVLPAVLDHRLVDRGVATVRDHCLSVMQLVVGAPHLAGVANHRRHGSVDDHIRGHVQVGDALVGVDHRHRRALFVKRFDVALDRIALLARQRLDGAVEIADTAVGIEARELERVGVLLEHVLVELFDHDAEHDRIGDLHHGRLQVQREQHVAFLGVLDFTVDEIAQAAAAHACSIDDFAFLDGEAIFQRDMGAVFLLQLDLELAGLGDHGGLLATVEVAFAHVGDVRLRFAAPLAHAVRILAGVVLDRLRGTTIGVTLTQYRVDRAALGLVVAGLDRFLFVVLRLVRVVRQGIALALQLLDRGLELGSGSADVGQLDDVGFRRRGQLAQLGQIVADALLVIEQVRELRQDSSGQGNIASLDRDAGSTGEGFDDRQQRVGGQGRRFVSQGVDDLRRIGHVYSLTSLWQWHEVSSAYGNANARRAPCADRGERFDPWSAMHHDGGLRDPDEGRHRDLNSVAASTIESCRQPAVAPEYTSAT